MYLIISKLIKANLVYAFFGLLLSVILARELGPLLKGELTLFLLISSIFSLAMRFGLDTSIIRFIKKKDANFTLVTNSIFLALSIIFSLLLLLLLVSNYSNTISHFFNNQEYYYFLYLLVPLEVVGILIASYLLGSGQITKYSISIVSQPAAMLAMLIILFVLKIDFSLLNVIIFIVISFLTKLIYLVFETRHLFALSERFNLVKSLDLFRFGLKSHIGNILDFFIIRTDILLISFFIGMEAVGIYSIAVLAEKVNIISNSVGSAVLSKIKSSEDANLVNKVLRLTLPILLIIIFLTYVSSEYIIILLFGDAFQNAAQPFIILIIGFSILFISKPIKAYLVVIDKPILLTHASTLALLFNLTLNLLLIPIYGLKGAAIATTIANIVYVLFLLYHFKKNTNGNLKSILFLRKSDFK